MHRTNAKFPPCLCYVCEKPLTSYDGTLRFDSFIPYLESFKVENPNSEALVKSNYAAFVNTLINAYFRQFPSLKIIKLPPLKIEKDLKDEHENQPKLELLLKQRPDKHVGIILHNRCLPRNVFSVGYPIDLDELDEPEKIEAMLTKLKDKIWFNSDGWQYISNDLIGKQIEVSL